MQITARVENALNHHHAVVTTGEQSQSIDIKSRPGGFGSSANGGELLFLALATCFCNDIYREAAKQGIAVRSVNVEVSGEFGGPGDPARNITYRASVDADATPESIEQLLRHTDKVAEIHNTLRQGCEVTLAARPANG